MSNINIGWRRSLKHPFDTESTTHQTSLTGLHISIWNPGFLPKNAWSPCDQMKPPRNVLCEIIKSNIGISLAWAGAVWCRGRASHCLSRQQMLVTNHQNNSKLEKLISPSPASAEWQVSHPPSPSSPRYHISIIRGKCWLQLKWRRVGVAGVIWVNNLPLVHLSFKLNFAKFKVGVFNGRRHHSFKFKIPECNLKPSQFSF